MKERPILFSGAMVRALLDGRKTQTRRVVSPQPPAECGIHYMLGNESWLQPEDRKPLRHSWEAWGGPLFDAHPEGHLCGSHSVKSPYGAPGDRLWVREAWRTTNDLDSHSGSRIAELCLDAGYRTPWAPIQYEADGIRVKWEHTSTPPHNGDPAPGRYRHARFMPRWASRTTLEVTGVRVERLQDISTEDCIAEGMSTTLREHDACVALRDDYRALWESLNGSGSWDANPFVWAIEFKRIEQ